MALRIPFQLLLVSFAASVRAQSISAPSTPGIGAYGPLDPSFAGFGIEPSNLFSFTGGNSQNGLTVQLLQNLAEYAGLPPHIRLGGNTQDYMVYDSSYDQYNLRVNSQAQDGVNGIYKLPANGYTFGKPYFTALNRFPANTPVTWGLNLAYDKSDYADVITTEAQAVVDNLSNLKLNGFEIGNEPDLYLQNGFRTGAWSGTVYTQEWLARAAVVYERVLKSAGIGAQFFEAPATASTIGTTFEVNQLVAAGIRDGANGTSTFLSAWNQHDYFYFVGVSPYGLTLDHLTALKNTEDQFAYWISQVKAATATGLPYQLREMASAGPVGLAGISDTFGAALWTFNFICYCAANNLSSVQFHMTDNSYASPWAPVSGTGYQKGVRPSYYAFAAWAQLMGSSNGTLQMAAVTPTSLPSGYADYVRAYAGYTSKQISSVSIINGMQANATDNSKHGINFKLSNLPAGETLYVSTLTAAGADSTAGTTWNGISFESNDGGTAKTVNSTISTVSIGSNGQATVFVRDSSAVIAQIGFQLGSKAVSIDGVTTTMRKSAAPSATTGASSTPILVALAAMIFLAWAD